METLKRKGKKCFLKVFLGVTFIIMIKPLLKIIAGDAARFAESDELIDKAMMALSRGDQSAALGHFKAAYALDAHESILTRVSKEAAYLQDPLHKADYYLFVAAHSDVRKTAAITGAVQAVEAAAKQANHHSPEGIATRVLDLFQVLPTDLNGTLQRGRMLEIWHTQITEMLQRDALAERYTVKTFLCGEVAKRSITGLDAVTSGVLNGAIMRVLTEQRHAGVPSRLTVKKLKATHQTPTGPNGQPYLN